jgi:hypothetical protein
MKDLLRRLALGIGLIGVLGAGNASGQDVPRAALDQIEAVADEAYRSASPGFPCKIKTRGKPVMLRWEEVDHCLNGAAGRVDWDALVDRLEGVRTAHRVSEADFQAAIDSALSARAMSYEKLFVVNKENALLPLTNSVLKYLPADSLHQLPVTDKVGIRVGTFLGTYSYERKGGLASANSYRLVLFQYSDRNGNVQSSSEKLLLDSFGVPWDRARTHRGFRLPADRLLPGKK